MSIELDAGNRCRGTSRQRFAYNTSECLVAMVPSVAARQVVLSMTLFITSHTRDPFYSLVKEERLNLHAGQSVPPYRRTCACCTGPPPCAVLGRCPPHWLAPGCCRSECVGSGRRHSPPSTETRMTSRTRLRSLQRQHATRELNDKPTSSHRTEPRAADARQ